MPRKILTVDDSKAVRIIVKKSFKKFDVEIIEASNGVEGLAAAAAHKPDLILLDVTMPVMDGVEMLTKLKADDNVKNIPVIMLTAEAGRENVMKIAKIGIRDYIVKPFKEDVLVDKASRIVDINTQGDAGGIDLDSCFSEDDVALTVTLPAEVGANTPSALSDKLSERVAGAVDSGLGLAVFDMSALSEANATLLTAIGAAISSCTELSLNHGVVVSDAVKAAVGAHEAGKSWSLYGSVDEAKSAAV